MSIDGAMKCKIWYSISQTVSDLGNIHDRWIRALAVSPHSARRRGTRGLTARAVERIVPVPRCPPDNGVHYFADNV